MRGAVSARTQRPAREHLHSTQDTLQLFHRAVIGTAALLWKFLLYNGLKQHKRAWAEMSERQLARINYVGRAIRISFISVPDSIGAREHSESSASIYKPG